MPGTAAKRDAKAPYQLLKSGRSARVWLRDPRIEALGKDLPVASPVRATKTPYRQARPNTATMGRHIRQITLVPAVDATGKVTTARALGPSTEGTGHNDHLIRFDRNVIHHKAGRQQPGGPSGFRHEQLPIATSCDKITDLHHGLHRD
ncbi:MAG: hypothetical protein AAFV49_22265 [Pseudomonadota bacterium]